LADALEIPRPARENAGLRNDTGVADFELSRDLKL
jgi:hypothetical protein